LIIQKKKPTLHTGNLRHFAKNTAGVLGEHWLFGQMYASTFAVEVTKRLCSSKTLVNKDSYLEITKHESSQKDNIAISEAFVCSHKAISRSAGKSVG
jgi:hypothetical protein